jgi:hypothetical protein
MDGYHGNKINGKKLYGSKKHKMRTRKGIFWENIERKKVMERERKMKIEKIKFSLENAAEKFVQGGYQPDSDTMLGNMTSMEEMREKLQTLCIDQTKILQYEKS